MGILGSKITAGGDCSHEIKRRLLLGRKAMKKLDSVSKSRDIALLAKVCLGKAVVFPIGMNGCESWTTKKAEHQRTDSFELWWWRRLLRISCTARRSKQSILKEINPKFSLQGLMLKLKLLYFGHLILRNDSLEKTLMLGKTEGRRRRGEWDGCMTSPTQWTWIWANYGRLWRTGKPGVLHSMGSQRVRDNCSNWTTTKDVSLLKFENLIFPLLSFLIRNHMGESVLLL